jgi:hypothetical protein
MADWVKAREFGTRFEADMARARLESADIPATIKSHEGGMFGPGFQGAVPSGVELHVPSARLAEARELLTDPET